MKFSGRRIEGNAAGGHLVVRLKLQHILDPADVAGIISEIEAALAKYRATRVVLNFSRVKQMSSHMLGRLLNIKKACEARKGRLSACGLKGEARKAFELCGFHKLIPVFRTEEEALAE